MFWWIAAVVVGLWLLGTSLLIFLAFMAIGRTIVQQDNLISAHNTLVEEFEDLKMQVRTLLDTYAQDHSTYVSNGDIRSDLN